MTNLIRTWIMLAVMIACAISILDASPARAKNAAVSLSGEFQVVAIRRASDVAGPPDDAALHNILGKTVSLDATFQWWDGTSCANWRTEERSAPAVNIYDPILSDTQIGPIDGERSTGDKTLNKHLNVYCDDRAVTSLTQIDNRVLVTSSKSGTQYVILERKLDGNAIEAVQRELITMKFLERDAAPAWDEESLHALAAFAEYRGAAFRFQRPALTQNLLDGLNIPNQPSGLPVLKIIYASPVAAYFYGEEAELAPREFGTRKLAFRFKDDNREYAFSPAGELFDTDWRFDVFSPQIAYVLLLQSHYGPYHVVRIGNLKAYLQGDAEPDFIVGAQHDSEPSAVLSDAKWVTSTSFEYMEACCGEERVRKWTVPEKAN